MTFTPKAATIGGTISFNDRDSFSFQISGEIASAEDYIGLAAFAGGALLGQFRDADPETLRTVRQFVSRFSSIPEVDLPAVPPTRGSASEVAPTAPPGPEALAPPPQKVPAAAEQAAAAAAQCIKPPAAPPKPEASAPSAPPEGFGICAECGEAVPSNQAKLSNMFMNKTLCKKCMDSPGGSA